jgi:hypothetical protein
MIVFEGTLAAPEPPAAEAEAPAEPALAPPPPLLPPAAPPPAAGAWLWPLGA